MIIASLLLPSLAAAGPGLGAPPPLPGRWAYDAVWAGGAWEVGVPGTAEEVGVLWDEPVELDLAFRNVSDGPTWQGTGVSHRVRLSRDEIGRTVVNELSIQGRFVGLTIRPAMGDRLDLSVLGGRWDQNLFGVARPWTHLQVFVPLHLVAVGFSDTDADDDIALRYYAAAGAGIGVDWMFRVAGPVGLRLRAEGAADTLHRLRREERDQVRHELWGRVEGDLVLVDEEMPMTFGVWAEQRTQFETRDGPAGVDRQVIAGGIRFGVRLFRGTDLFGEGPYDDYGDEGYGGADPYRVDPDNLRAIERAERRRGRTNDRNGRRIAVLVDEAPLAEETPPPATPEEHEANNAANGGP